MELYRTKKLLHSKDTINKIKSSYFTQWEEVFANHISDKRLISKLYKNSHNSTAKKKTKKT